MLKIKDSVDLKDLEKFGFKIKGGLIWKPKKGTWEVFELRVDPNSRLILSTGISDLFYTKEDTLFDLIKSDLIEKVDNTGGIK